MTRDDQKTKDQLLKALRDSEELYRGISESVPTSIVITDRSGRVVDLSPHHVAQFGRGKTGREDYIGKLLPERPSVVAANLTQEYWGVLRGKGFREEAVRFPKLSGGGEAYLDVSGVPLVRDGKVTGAVFIHQDVTDRKRGEDALWESEERHRTLFETLAQGVVYQEADGTIISANPAAQRILGLTLDQMRGRTSMDPRWKAIRADGSELPGEEHPSMLSFLSGNPVLGAVMGVFCPTQNKERWIEVDAVPLFKKGADKPHQVYATFSDITDRRLAEQRLMESEERHKTVSELTSDYAYCFRLDPDGTLVNEWVTGALDRVTGFSREELIRAGGWEGMIHPDDQSIPEDQLAAVLSNQSKSVEYRIVTKAGRVRWMLDHARPIWDQNEERVRRIEGAVRDITDLKEAEKERLDLQLRVQHAHKLESLGTLAGGIAHDFNNILMAILGNAELALSSLAPTEPVREEIDKIQLAAKRAAKLANQMLAYSGKGHFLTETVSLSEVTAGLIGLLEASVPRTTRLDFRLDESIPAIEGNKSQISQVVVNFVSNASEALESRAGVVRVTTGTMEWDRARLPRTDLTNECADGTYAFVAVDDTGVGMDQETASQVFDPFFTTKFTGRGLGLAAVFGIVRGHRGGITVDSEPGAGTTIRAFFPVAESVRASPPASVEVAQGNTILLVDDESQVLDVGERMLSMAGYEVKTACDGIEAVEMFKQYSGELACVILDLTMPRMGGELALIEFQKIKEDVPVLLSSGYTPEDVEDQMSTKGFAGILQKPYTMNELLGKISSVLGTK